MQYIILLLFFLSSLSSEVLNVNIAMSPKTFFKDKKFSNLVIKVIESSFNNKYSDIKIHILPYSSEKKIISDFFNKKVELIILSPKFFFKEEKRLNKNISKKWTLRINNEKYEQYYLITHKDSNASIKNIKNYTVNFRDGVLSAEKWFESLVYEAHHKPYLSVIHKRIYFKKRSKLIYQVFFKKDMVSVVTKNDFDTLLEINPQLKKNIKILKKSQKIYLSLLGFSSKNMNKKREEIIFNHVTNIDSIMSNEHYKSLTSLSKAYFLNDKDLDKLRIFYKKYETYKKYEH